MFSPGIICYGGTPGDFVFQVNLTVDTAPGRTVTLPIETGGAGYSHNFTVSWGDGSSGTITAYNDADRIHEYASIGTYNIGMTGTCEWFSWSGSSDVTKIKKILACRNDMGFEVFSMNGATNLNSVVALGTMASLTSAYRMFYGCTSLTSIPSKIFDGLTSVTTFEDTFRDCSNITSLPTDLFRYNTSVTNFSATFVSCGLSSIPTDLFRYNTSATDFTNTFNSCSYLTTIPSGLFQYNTGVTTFYATFSGSGLTSIPTDLFRYCTSVTNFEYTFAGTSFTTIPTDTFRYNTAVTTFSFTFSSASITAIPTDLFRYCTSASNFSGTFVSCNSISQAIDGNMFLYNTGVTTFQATFSGCGNITGSGWGSGAIPETVSGTIIYNAEHQSTPPSNTNDCFFNCTNLTSYLSIPVAWR